MLGESFSLAGMQERIWREFKDERLLFLLPNGTVSSSPLPSDILEADEVETAALESTFIFTRDPGNVRFLKKRLWLHPMFKKWKKAFLLNYGGSTLKKAKDISPEELAVINFLYQHGENEEKRSALEALDFKVYYLPEKNELRKQGG